MSKDTSASHSGTPNTPWWGEPKVIRFLQTKRLQCDHNVIKMVCSSAITHIFIVQNLRGSCSFRYRHLIGGWGHRWATPRIIRPPWTFLDLLFNLWVALIVMKTFARDFHNFENGVHSMLKWYEYIDHFDLRYSLGVKMVQIYLSMITLTWEIPRPL